MYKTKGPTRVFAIRLTHRKHYQKVFERLHYAYTTLKVGLPIITGGESEYGAFILLDASWGTNVNEPTLSYGDQNLVDIHKPEDAFTAMYGVEDALGRLDKMNIVPTTSVKWYHQIVVRYDETGDNVIGSTIIPLAFDETSTQGRLVLNPLDGIDMTPNSVYKHNPQGIMVNMGDNPTVEAIKEHGEEYPLAFEYRGFQACPVPMATLKDNELFKTRLATGPHRNSPWALVHPEYYQTILNMIEAETQFPFVQRGYLEYKMFHDMFRMFAQASDSIDSPFCVFPHDLRISLPCDCGCGHNASKNGLAYTLHGDDSNDIYMNGKEKVITRMRNWFARTRDKCKKAIINMNVGEHANSVVIDFASDSIFMIEPHGDFRVRAVHGMTSHHDIYQFFREVTSFRSNVLFISDLQERHIPRMCADQTCTDDHGVKRGWQTRVSNTLKKRIGLKRHLNPGFCSYWSAVIALQLILQEEPLDYDTATEAVAKSFRQNNEIAAIFVAFIHTLHLRLGV